MIKMILAVDSGNAIGWKNGDLPWKIPTDMKRFKDLTTGGTVLMGFNTFLSLGRTAGLPNRKNILLTRRPWSEARGLVDVNANIEIISSLDYIAQKYSTDDLWIIGGASVYDEAIDRQLVDEIYLTVVQENSGADVTLKHDFSAWKRFVLQEQTRGVYWDLEDIEVPTVADPSPSITFIQLRKIK